jgi:putative zinc finger/helix-turn-helix YgiT family protein
MKCVVCGSPMKTKRENFRYDACGLPNVTLVGVEVSRCAACGEFEVALEQMEDLHKAIAAAVIRKPARLSAAEIKFLRKYLGWSGADFADHIGATPETVSRWETGFMAMGAQADRALRLMVATQQRVKDYALETLKSIREDKTPHPVRLGLKRDKGGWHAEAA